jgi:organic hydroperoxide reductase OsmC/OhrA
VGEYRATVEWAGAGEGDFTANRYSRAHHWRFDGGAEVAASASPQVVPPPFSDPSGVDPEEALIASASSCHMLWFLHLAREAGHLVTRYRDEAVGHMGKDERGRTAFTRIALRPRIDFAGEAPDAQALARLHHAAHEACFIASSLRCEIVVES